VLNEEDFGTIAMDNLEQGAAFIDTVLSKYPDSVVYVHCKVTDTCDITFTIIVIIIIILITVTTIIITTIMIIIIILIISITNITPGGKRPESSGGDGVPHEAHEAGHVLPAVRCPLSAVCSLLSTVCCLLSTVCRLLSTVYCLQLCWRISLCMKCT
jgi:hypothetical protein